MMGFLNNIKEPAEIRTLNEAELKKLAEAIREKIVNVTSKKGGHLAASLGAVELAVALHYSFASPKDKIVWDVGHQSYAHKLLTGRAHNFDTLREMGGLSGFPNVKESEHDHFTSGHSATSISAALGMAAARDLKKEEHKVIAVIGDASLSTGLAFEGMNNAGHLNKDIIVVLNDNEHSISKPVGAMSRYLNRVISNPLYNRVRAEAENIVKNIPKLGPATYKTVKKFQEGVKNLLVPGILFEELGFRYFGPIDGHNLSELIAMFKNISSIKEPVFVHVVTKKGKGYKYSEENPVEFHGVDTFNIKTGEALGGAKKDKTFTEHFSDKIVGLAEKDKNIIAITAAMPQGTGLQAFYERFPERFFDVGITESHAVCFAAGLAKGGLKPVVAIYSTFLQRSYDQLIHDVALQNLPVVFCVDRAGLVGKDGPTHHGMFDLVYSRTLPNFTVLAPKDGPELEIMLEKALEWNRPVLIRYPRQEAKQIIARSSYRELEMARSEKLREGKDLTLLAVGSMVTTAIRTSDILSKKGIEAEVINARFVKPVDRDILESVARKGKKLFILEEGITRGGFGSAVLEFFERENISNIAVRVIGLPDEFIEHGAREELLRKYHLTPDEVAITIEAEL